MVQNLTQVYLKFNSSLPQVYLKKLYKLYLKSRPTMSAKN